MKPRKGKKSSTHHSNEQTKEGAELALRRGLRPMVELMLDAGMTVRRLNRILRETAVSVAANRVLKDLGRESQSRVAIITGLPRSEVRKLSMPSGGTKQAHDQNTAERVMTAWFDNPEFADPNGHPAILPIFGVRQSFERLVLKHGKGIPTRAMLDELVKMDLVEQIEPQMVRAKNRVRIRSEMTKSAILTVGERSQQFLETLIHNISERTQRYYEGGAVAENVDAEMAFLLKSEIARRAGNFVSETESFFKNLLNKQSECPPDNSKHFRLGVTIYYFQNEIAKVGKAELAENINRRKNLRRKERNRSGS